MIEYPQNWKQDYSFRTYTPLIGFISTLRNALLEINVTNLAYSGGIDSTIILCLLSKISNSINTYTISCRTNHPDIKYARMGSDYYKSTHTEIIVKPNSTGSDRFDGDSCVRQFFENIDIDKIICCDGIDEFMCGYYDHIQSTVKKSKERYGYYLHRLTPKHLIPLNKNSGDVKVYLPYLDESLISFMSYMSLETKLGKPYGRKNFIKLVAKHLDIPDEFINRNKYGFCDAFLQKDKRTI